MAERGGFECSLAQFSRAKDHEFGHICWGLARGKMMEFWLQKQK